VILHLPRHEAALLLQALRGDRPGDTQAVARWADRPMSLPARALSPQPTLERFETVETGLFSLGRRVEARPRVR